MGIFMLAVDLFIFCYMVFLAISQRGTLTGWLAAIAVVVYTVVAVMRSREAGVE